MRIVGEVCLLISFIASAYAAFAVLVAWKKNHRGLLRAGVAASLISFAGLTVCVAVLAHALIIKDFNFKYVAEYSSRLLPWYYSLSALWVGQAGSLLLWAWMLALLALVFWFFSARQQTHSFREPAFGLVLAYQCFLIITMVFGVDPMEANVAPGSDGVGLSPLLQHPAMLIHPPIVFLGYATWCFPAAIAIGALLGSSNQSFGADWIHAARPWALCAWIVLGAGVLLGANWSYEELGWGGYWGWDPVENGSLIPWLTGTALLHGMMAWKSLGILKKATLGLAITTFGMCNFATFLTRSGIFSSLHAFSRSPIGWLFLGLMIVLGLGGGLLLRRRWLSLTGESTISTFWSREAQIVINSLALLSLAAVAVAGTLFVALSDALVGRRVILGPAFYNNVLIPTGLVLLFTLSLAPLLRWGRPPTTSQWRAQQVAAAIAFCFAGAGWMCGLRHPLALAVTALAAFAGAALIASLVIDARKSFPEQPWRGAFLAIAVKRRQYASFMIHMGFVCLVVGITGSSLGTRQDELVLKPGETVESLGRRVRFVALNQREQTDKFVAEAELEIFNAGSKSISLQPARHLHRLQNEWTTEVAIHSGWSGDLYAILHGQEADDATRLTLIDNPLIRFLWLGGGVMAVGTVLALWPVNARKKVQRLAPPPAKFISRSPERQLASRRTSIS